MIVSLAGFVLPASQSHLDLLLPFQRRNMIRLCGSKHPAITSSMHHQLLYFGYLFKTTKKRTAKNKNTLNGSLDLRLDMIFYKGISHEPLTLAFHAY